MYPILEIGLSDKTAFAKSHSPPQPRRRRRLNPCPGRHQRVRWMASRHSSPPHPPTSTHELPPALRKRRNSSPKLASKSAERRGNDGFPAGAATSTRLSLRRLKQGERHQRIRHGASELLRLSQNFSGYHGDAPGGGFHAAHDQPLPSDSELRAMARLSHTIANDIVEIYSLRNGDSSYGSARPRGAARNNSNTADPQSLTPGHGHANVARNTARHEAEIYCHKCHRVDTPQWRPGPDGPMTLCNVCGLVYSKRQRSLDGLPAPDSVDIS